MRTKLIITTFLVFSIHGILFDPYFGYNRLHDTIYKNMTVEMYMAMSRACYEKKGNLLMMLAIGKSETDFENTMKNGFDSGVWQINIKQAEQMGVPLTYFLNIRNCAYKAVSIYNSALKKSKGDLELTLAYYNAGENANITNYKKSGKWNKYVPVIMKNYYRSKEIISSKVIVK